MALTLTEYSFSKRKNSTAVPTASGSDASIVLKHGTNIISPVFTMSSGSEPVFNYCKFQNRYYFVNNKTCLRNDMWDIECEEDYLGTWKTEIGNTNAMILYATGGPGNIVDNRISITKDITITSATSEPSWVLTPNNPKIIVGITGTGSNGLYSLSSKDVLNSMLDGVDAWGQLFTQTEDVLRQMLFGGGASDNLRGAWAIPLDISIDVYRAVNLYLGNYPCKDANGNALSGGFIRNTLYRSSDSVNIPWHYNDWRRNSPYTNIILYIPCFGTFTLPASQLVNESSIKIENQLSISNGDMSCQIYGGTSNRMIATANTNVAISLMCGSTSYDYNKIISGVVAGAGALAGGLVSGGALLPIAGSALIGAAQSIKSGLEGNPTGIGSLGGSAVCGADEYIHCWCVSYGTSDAPSDLNDVCGVPVMAKNTIGSYSGYVQTDGASVAGTMLDAEREAINQMLDRGIYYE